MERQKLKILVREAKRKIKQREGTLLAETMDWIFSFNILWRFIQVAVYINNLFLFIAE